MPHCCAMPTRQFMLLDGCQAAECCGTTHCIARGSAARRSRPVRASKQVHSTQFAGKLLARHLIPSAAAAGTHIHAVLRHCPTGPHSGFAADTVCCQVQTRNLMRLHETHRLTCADAGRASAAQHQRKQAGRIILTKPVAGPRCRQVLQPSVLPPPDPPAPCGEDASLPLMLSERARA
jgi:hypothetical protein